VKYTLTLTRWHKVAERIKAAIKESEARAIAAFTATAISPWNKEGVEVKAFEIAARGKADVAFVETGLSAVAEIRAALTRRNAGLGIADKLAEADAVNRRAALYLAIVEKQRADMVRPEDLRHVPQAGGAITLAIAERPLVEELALKLAADQARMHALLDEVAELNRSKLELELPDELAIVAGLAA
jgi:hypothetical protein